MVFKWLSYSQAPKESRTSPNFISGLLIKWSKEFVNQILDLPRKHWILGCTISELVTNKQMSIIDLCSLYCSCNLLSYYLGQNFWCDHHSCWKERVVTHLGGSWLQRNFWVLLAPLNILRIPMEKMATFWSVTYVVVAAGCRSVR